MLGSHAHRRYRSLGANPTLISVFISIFTAMKVNVLCGEELYSVGWYQNWRDRRGFKSDEYQVKLVFICLRCSPMWYAVLLLPSLMSHLSLCCCTLISWLVLLLSSVFTGLWFLFRNNLVSSLSVKENNLSLFLKLLIFHINGKATRVCSLIINETC